VERSRIVLLAAGDKLEHPHPGRHRGNQPDQRSAYLAGAWAETLFSYRLPASSFQLPASSYQLPAIGFQLSAFSRQRAAGAPSAKALGKSVEAAGCPFADAKERQSPRHIGATG
jgi:hypothetical protein